MDIYLNDDFHLIWKKVLISQTPIIKTFDDYNNPIRLRKSIITANIKVKSYRGQSQLYCSGVALLSIAYCLLPHRLIAALKIIVVPCEMEQAPQHR